MELQDQVRTDWSQYFCIQPPVEFDTNANHHLLCSDLKSISVRLKGNSDPFCGIWTDADQARDKTSNNRSFAMDARIRLDSLKSGCNSPLPCRAMDGMLHDYNCKKELWDSEESEEEESALDLVELLDVEDDVQDEENWLYESPKKQVDRTESALGWCRRVLDNPNPETVAACRSLINKLDQRSSHFNRHPTVFHHTGNASIDKTSTSTTYNTSDSLDTIESSISHDSTATSYRLQDITDVHIMARMQEASLRHDFVSTPAAASPQTGLEQPVTFPSNCNMSIENNNDDFTPGSENDTSSSSCWRRGLSTLSSSSSQSPTSLGKQGCLSPKLTRLHQQVTQFKLLKLAQNQAASPGRTRSPLRTSLRSLQAVRNSRSLETEDYQPDSQITYPPSASTNSNGSLNLARNSSDRTTAMNRGQRSQSVSPCRIPHPAKGYLSFHGRVFASPERSTAVAWARNVPSTRR